MSEPYYPVVAVATEPTRVLVGLGDKPLTVQIRELILEHGRPDVIQTLASTSVLMVWYGPEVRGGV